MAYENNTGFPSVSDIIRPYINTKYFTDECRIRGTAIHACCASYIQGLYFPRLKPEYQGYMDSFKRWADKNIEEVILVEKRLVDKDLGYCGQLDAILRLKGHEKPFVVDLKTGKSIQRSWKLQLAAYTYLEAMSAPQIGATVDAYNCISLRVKAEGTGCRAVKYKNCQENFEIFKGMLKSYKFFNDKVKRMHNMEAM
jgi:hypothetical protein